MNPFDIYNRARIISSDKNIYDIEDYLDELNNISFNYQAIEESNRIEVKKHFFHNFDGERTMSLYSVWFDNKPIMVTQGAGRGERDHRMRFITDIAMYIEMIGFIRSCSSDVVYDVYSETENIPELTMFYGITIENKDLFDE